MHTLVDSIAFHQGLPHRTGKHQRFRHPTTRGEKTSQPRDFSTDLIEPVFGGILDDC